MSLVDVKATSQKPFEKSKMFPAVRATTTNFLQKNLNTCQLRRIKISSQYIKLLTTKV